MRLLFFNRSFHPDVEATGQLLTELCQNLSQDLDVTVIVGRPYNAARFGSWLPVKREQLGRIRILRAYNPRMNKERFLGRVLNLFSYFCFSFVAGFFARRPDVIVVETDPPVLGLIGLFFARLYRAKFVFYLQDLYPDVGIALGQLKNGTVVAMLKASTRRSLLGADSIVVLGEDMKKRILDKGYRLNGRVRVIPNWADTTQVRPWQDGQLGGQRSVEQRMGRISIGHEKAQGAQGRNPFRQQHQLDGQFVVMFSGNIGLSQGLDRVIEVAGALADNPTIRFVLIGEGAAKAGLVERVKREELGNVLFLPYQPKEKLSESLSAADVHLVTLRRGLAGLIVPSKVYGIMAVGRPFIAAIEEDSHVAGIIREHRCGIRVEPDSTEQLTAAILWAVAHRDELEAMGQRGREAAVTQYDRKISVGKFRAMLEELRPEVRSQGSEAGD